MKKKVLVPAIALVLVLCCAVGGTLAWLTAQTEPIQNVFTVGNVDIDLTESPDLDLKMVPGRTITKDPVATVKADSEDCYLFVQVDKSANFDDFMTFKIADGWSELPTVSDVYYRVVNNSAEDQPFGVLLDDQVTVKDTVTQEMMDAIIDNPETAPTLTFTAYGIQQYKDNNTPFTPEEAWAAVSTANP